MKEKVLFCWSGGKDSALCLYKLLRSGSYEVAALVTTISMAYKRVVMHGVSEELLEAQARSIGLPLEKVYMEESPDNSEYERKMEALLIKYREKGVRKVVFGDLFLEDLRAYREKNLSRLGMSGLYPLWISSEDKRAATAALLEEFMDLGFRTVTCCVDDAFFSEDMAGRYIDRDFIRLLPETADPCGENGEFHTFTVDGPIFRYPLNVRMGQKVYKPLKISGSENTSTKGFWYCELTLSKLQDF
jgi:uncharacterized protein (TIGR00290 family)